MSRCSITGYFVQIGTTPVSWKTKKQDTVPYSSAEAEYRAMANATSKVVWLRNLLTCLGFSIPSSILHCDNQVALHIAANTVFHESIKHIEVDCHFVCKELVSGAIITCYTPTTEQIVDMFRKGLGQRQFH